MGVSSSGKVVGVDKDDSPASAANPTSTWALSRHTRQLRPSEHSSHGAAHAPQTFLPDAEGMKNQVREQMCKPKYDVSMYYHDTGFTQWIAKHPRFEHTTLAVIGLNALWIWIDTDHNPGSMLLDSPALFQSVEYFFCIFFTFEWSMRFGAFKQKCSGLKDCWFVFDSLLVATMVFESWLMTAIMLFMTSNGGAFLGNSGILRMARLLRLTRMARMARLLRAMPELLIIIKGMVAAMRSVIFTLGLLFVLLYIFGVAFVQLCDGSECQQFFPNVPEAMHELLLETALMDGLGNLVRPLKEQSLMLMLVLYAFMFLSALTIMNMLIGVICEVVSAVAATERESLSLGFVRDKLQDLIFNETDNDGDHLISKDEFSQLLVTPKAISTLQDVGVDVVGLVDIKDTLFEADAMAYEDEDGFVIEPEEKKLTFSDLMGLVFDLRGGNTATVRDIVNLRKYIHARFTSMEQKLSRGPRRHSSCSPDRMSGIPPQGTCDDDGLGELVTKSTYDSANHVSSARCQDGLLKLQSLMSAHEVVVAALEAENRQLKEQVAKLAGTVSKSALRATARACCKESVLTTANPDLVLPPYEDQPPPPPPPPPPPKEPPRDLQTDDSSSSSASGPPLARPPHGDHCQDPVVAFSATLRATADESAADHARLGVDASTTDSLGGSGSACDAVANWSPQHGIDRQQSERYSVVAASSAAMSVAAKSAEEPW